MTTFQQVLVRAMGRAACVSAMVMGAIGSCYGQSRFVEGALIRDATYAKTGLGVAAGLELPRRLALHFEVERPTWYVVHDEGRGSHAALDHTFSARTTAIAVLLGRRFGSNPRIHLELLGGFAALFESTKMVGYFDTLAPDGSVANHDALDDRSTDHYTAFTFGVDVPIALGRGVSVIPRLRGHSTIGNWLGPRPRRAEVAMRWQF